MSSSKDDRRGVAPLPLADASPEAGHGDRSEVLDRLLAPVVRDFAWRRTGAGGADLEAYCATWPPALRPAIRERCRVALAVQGALRRLRARDRARAEERRGARLDPGAARRR